MGWQTPWASRPSDSRHGRFGLGRAGRCCWLPGEGSGGGSGEGSGKGSGQEGGSAACEKATAEAATWVSANRACTYVTDCTQLDALCFRGEGAGTCGTVAVSADADVEAWTELHDALSGCGCGAAACGEWVACGDEGQCVGIGPAGDICPEVSRDAGDFIAANRTCSTNEDCQLVTADCYMGPEQACAEIALNVDADFQTWAELNTLLGQCGPCGGSACGATAECGPTGSCGAVFP